MAIAEETVVIKVEGNTDGAVKATEKLVASQAKLDKQTQAAAASMANLARTMIGLPPPPEAPASGLARISGGLKSAGIDLKEFSAGLREMGKGITMDLVRGAIQHVGQEFDAATAKAVQFGIQGAAIGAQVAGPLGAVAGLIGGLAASNAYDWFDEGKHARLMTALDDEITTDKELSAAYKQISKDVDDYRESVSKLENAQIDARRAAIDNAKAQFVNAQALATDKVKQLETALFEAKRERENDDLRSGRSFGISQAEIAIARQLRDARLEAANSNTIYGKTVVDIKSAESHHTDEIVNLNKAFENGKITLAEYRKAMAAVNAESISAAKSAKATRAALLQAWAPVLQALGAPSPKNAWAGAEQAEAHASAQAQADADWDDDAEHFFDNNLVTEGNSDLQRDHALKASPKYKLEQMFGPIDDFHAYKTAWSNLGTVVSGAMDAWIDGSESTGKAIKRLAADALKADASQMMGQALLHGAYAIGSLAFGDARGAAQHGAAAGEFLAGSLALAGLARALGGGGGASASAGGKSADSRQLGSGGGSGGQLGPGITANISYGDSFADDSPRMRTLKAQKMVRKALGNSGVQFR